MSLLVDVLLLLVSLALLAGTLLVGWRIWRMGR
jgi:hypothetical protein